jgi:phage terminase Nu1 subunit (DNA packaging protein)
MAGAPFFSPMAKLSKGDQQARVTITEANRRKAQALAELRELELRQNTGELIQTAAVRAVWCEHHARIRDRFLAIPDRLAEGLANQPAAAVREMLLAEIEDALRNVAENVI